MLILLVPVLIVLLFVVAIILLCCKKKIVSAVVFILTIALNLYTETFPLHLGNLLSSSQKAENTIRVISYNIKYSSDYLEQQKDSLNGLISFLETQDADILVLPESRVWNNKNLRTKLLDLYTYNSFSGFKGSEIYVETAVFSRFPIENICRLGEEYIYGMDIVLPNTKLKLIACHLASNQYHSTLRGGEGLIDNLKKGFESRKKQTQIIYDSLQLDSPQMPLLICGDMNDLSGSHTISNIQNRHNLHDAWWKGGCGYGQTFNGKGLLLRIDHILYSDQLNLQRVDVIHKDYSDHYPLIADFELQ